MTCYCCGESQFKYEPVLSDELVRQWGLSQEEMNYIDLQQGFRCVNCNNNLRSNVLAKSLLESIGSNDFLNNTSMRRKYRKLNILEINSAGDLTQFLSQFKNHRLIEYPEFDIQNLNLQDQNWDVVLHSDTLEHIPDYKKALGECYRILKPSGKLIFTTPIIVNRLSKSRQGLELSYHGSPHENLTEMLVHWEFGLDLWADLAQVGFESVKINFMNFPAGLAFTASR